MRFLKCSWLLPVIFFTACSSVNRENNAPPSISTEQSGANLKSAAPSAVLADRVESSEGQGNNKTSSSNLTSTGSSFADTVSGGVLPLNSNKRKINRIAEFHCSVDDVFKTTTGLERLVKSLGGVVEESNMQNSYPEVKTMYYKPDSNRQILTYTTSASIILRVPALYLDSVVAAIPGMVSFIQSRVLRQSDQTYTYLSNQLNAENDEKSADDAADLLKEKKRKDGLEVQQYRDNKRESKIDRQLQNLTLMDNVNYATVTVALIQPQQVFMQTVVNTDFITRTPIGIQFKTALNNGWEGIVAFFIWLVNIWPFLIFVSFCFLAYKIIRKISAAKRNSSDMLISPHQ